MKKVIKIFTILILGIVSLSKAQQPLKPGNIVVYRVGDGSAALSTSIMAKVFLEEYSPIGELIQIIEMPSIGSQKITVSGGNQYGYMTLSSNGKYLVVPGTNLNLGANPFTTTLERSIGLVDNNGAISSMTILPNNPDGNQPVSAVSDNGTNIWLAGNVTDIEYTTVGSTTSTGVLSTFSSTRAIAIADSQLYVAQSGGGIQKVGTGLPVGAGQSAVNLPGIGNINARGQFAFADLDPAVTGVDVLYACSQLGNGLGGIHKYSLVNGTWVLNGNVTATPATSGDIDRYIGLTIRVSGSSVTIFATRAGTNSNTLSGIQGGQLISLTDNSGYNGSFAGTPIVLADISNRFTANHAAFRGVALVPQACKTVANLKALNVTSSQATITWTATNGETNFEYVVTTSPTPPASGAIATNNTSFLITGLTNGVTYYVHVRTNCSLSQSEWSTVDFITSCRPPEIPFLNITTTATGVVKINWNTVFGTTSYEYFISTSPNPPSAGRSIIDTFLNIAGLSAVNTYYIHLRADCGSGAFSNWVSKSFTTGCFMPIVSFNVLHNNGLIKWNKINNVLKYEYSLTNTAARPLSGAYTTDTAYVTGRRLEGSVNYFHVRSICSNGSVSDWNTIKFNINGLNVFPNPVSGVLSINLQGVSNPQGQIVVADAMGRIMTRVKPTGLSVVIDTRTWSAGLYLVRYDDNGRNFIQRVVKQ